MDVAAEFEARGITASDINAATGIPRTSIARMLDHRGITLDTARRLVGAFPFITYADLAKYIYGELGK